MKIWNKFKALLSQLGGTSGPIMIAPPAPVNPFSEESLTKDFNAIVSSAYDERATAIRFCNDDPMGTVRFVVNRKWIDKKDLSKDKKWVDKFYKNTFKMTKNNGVKIYSNSAHKLKLDDTKFKPYGSMNTILFDYCALAGDRTQLTMHIVYNSEKDTKKGIAA